MSHHTATGYGRLRFAPLAVASGVVATAAMALSTSGALAGFTAQITNSVDTAASGTLVMQEQSSAGTTTCLSTDAGSAGTSVGTNASTCSTINKYGGSTVLYPGASSTTTVTVRNVGTVPAAVFTLTPGACTQGTNGAVNGSATDFCARLGVVVTQTVGSTTTTVTPANATAASLAAGGPLTLAGPVAPGASASYTFTVTLSPSAGNTYQGLSASQPLVWQFSS